MKSLIASQASSNFEAMKKSKLEEQAKEQKRLHL